MMGLGRCARSGVEDALNVHRFPAIFPVLFIHEEDRIVHRGAIVARDNDDSCSRIATMAEFLLQATRSEISKIQSVAASHRYYRVVAATARIHKLGPAQPPRRRRLHAMACE